MIEELIQSRIVTKLKTFQEYQLVK
jgi:hypothetical protein